MASENSRRAWRFWTCIDLPASELAFLGRSACGPLVDSHLHSASCSSQATLCSQTGEG